MRISTSNLSNKSVYLVPLLIAPFLSYADVTLEFDIIHGNKVVGNSILYISDEAVRSDIVLPNEHFSLVGLNEQAHYLIDVNARTAQKMSQAVSIKFAKEQMLKQGVRVETNEQVKNMMEMSADPNNDEDYNIQFESTSTKYYEGYQQDEVLFLLEPTLASNQGLSKADIQLIQKQAFNYQVLAKTSIGNFENLPIELLHIIKYQGFELFKSYHEISSDYTFKLISALSSPISDQTFSYQNQFKIQSIDMPVQQMSKALEAKSKQ